MTTKSNTDTKKTDAPKTDASHKSTSTDAPKVDAEKLTSEDVLVKQEVDAKAAEALTQPTKDGGSLDSRINRLNQQAFITGHSDVDAVLAAGEVAKADERRMSEERANAQKVVEAQNLVQRHSAIVDAENARNAGTGIQTNTGDSTDEFGVPDATAYKEQQDPGGTSRAIKADKVVVEK